MLQRKPIFPNVIEFNFQAGHVIGCNVYLVFDDNEWTLIDIGYEETVDEIIELIRYIRWTRIRIPAVGAGAKLINEIIHIW